MRCVRTKWKVLSCFTHVRVVLTLQSVDEMLKCDSSDVIEHKCSRWDVREGGGGGGGVKEQHKKQTAKKYHNLSLKLIFKKLFPFGK